ncbi:MAG: flagellar basal body-associated FliL family protein [Desulfovibrionaceae bacterium]
MASNIITKAQPDTGMLDMEIVSKADTKVALDMDDAPFLQESPAPAPATSTALTLDPEAPNDAEGAAQKKKKRILIIAAAAGLLAVAVVLWFFVFRTPPSLPPPPLAPEVVVVPSAPAKAEPKEYYITFDPFWVELPATGADGQVVFLVCKFSAISTSEMLAMEAQNKMIILRDAVYYYIKNKPYQYLIDPANTPTIKKDLNSVLSGYLAGGKIEGMLFESYLGR